MNLVLAALFVLGVCIGSLINLGTYRLAWHPRSIGPWSRRDPKAPPRRLSDRLPVIGWLGMRREAGLHGAGFWIRPMLLELFCGIGVAALYWWEIHRQGLLPPGAPHLPMPPIQAILNAHYAAHVLLITFMLVASMIDIDEWTIPDAITVPGTLVALAAAVVYPWSLLPEFVPPSAAAPGLQDWRLLAADTQYWRDPTADTWQILRPASPELRIGPLGLKMPHLAPQGIKALPQQGWLLATGLACWWLWCVALMPRTWYSRHGYRRALDLCLARVVRESITYRILVMGAIGSGAIAWVWAGGGTSWVALLSGLVGMAASGGLVWAVRIIGAATLKKEAMGFGDVTLMAMIGAFLGWQTGLIIFFIAPMFALVFGVVRLIVLRNSALPYGPFLCLGTVAAVVYWAAIWGALWPYFAVGWLVPVMVVSCLALMAPLLCLTRLIGDVLRGTVQGRRTGGR